MIKLYIKIQLFFINVWNTIKLLKYAWFLHSNHIFRDGNPRLILMVIQKFIELEHANYPESIVNSRSLKESSGLLTALTRVYLKTCSDAVLDQIMEVLKTEFIERNRNVN